MWVPQRHQWGHQQLLEARQTVDEQLLGGGNGGQARQLWEKLKYLYKFKVHLVSFSVQELTIACEVLAPEYDLIVCQRHVDGANLVQSRETKGLQAEEMAESDKGEGRMREGREREDERGERERG